MSSTSHGGQHKAQCSLETQECPILLKYLLCKADLAFFSLKIQLQYSLFYATSVPKEMPDILSVFIRLESGYILRIEKDIIKIIIIFIKLIIQIEMINYISRETSICEISAVLLNIFCEVSESSSRPFNSTVSFFNCNRI